MMNTATHIQNQREFAFSDEDFRFLAGLANSKTGIVLTENKRNMVYGRLARRLRALELTSFRDYCSLLQSPQGEEELVNLVNAVTTNLTSFFREAHHFEHFAGVIREVAEKSKRIRVWSAACSSGMEPYSMAMTMKHALPELHKWDAKILATDIDSNMLSIGMTGEYKTSDLEQLPGHCQQFVQSGSKPQTVRMRSDLKSLITFKQLNLLEPWPMKGPFDAIFCRNVVIYFDKPTKQRLFDRMANILPLGGWLYIGHSENLHGISDRFELVGRTIYRRVK